MTGLSDNSESPCSKEANPPLLFNCSVDYWGALMHDYNGMAKKNPKQLTQMIQKGIPPSLRGLIWQVLAKSKDGELEAKYADLLKETSAHEKQINRDMNRTFPNHEYFQVEGLGQESLFNVVKAYSLYDTEVGYCQGLSFVVGPLLLNNVRLIFTNVHVSGV